MAVPAALCVLPCVAGPGSSAEAQSFAAKCKRQAVRSRPSQKAQLVRAQLEKVRDFLGAADDVLAEVADNSQTDNDSGRGYSDTDTRVQGIKSRKSSD